MTVDFGTAAAVSFRPKQDDFIHPRGEAIEKEGQVTMIAREVHAEGRLFSIQQSDQAAGEAEQKTRCRFRGIVLPQPGSSWSSLTLHVSQRRIEGGWCQAARFCTFRRFHSMYVISRSEI